MSYKTRWFNQKLVSEVAEHFDVPLELLIEQGDGAYGCNMESKLRNHPDHTHAGISEYFEALCQADRVPVGSIDSSDGLLYCDCGWIGKGTGNGGRLIEGDRCPECGVHL